MAASPSHSWEGDFWRLCKGLQSLGREIGDRSRVIGAAGGCEMESPKVEVRLTFLLSVPGISRRWHRWLGIVAVDSERSSSFATLAALSSGIRLMEFGGKSSHCGTWAIIFTELSGF